MAKNNKPLKRSVLVGTISFIIILCIVLSAVQYYGYRKMIYERYEAYIENVINYAASNIDTDDLAECIRTGEMSEKYHELQRFLDGIRDGMNIHFIYLIEPLNTEPKDNIRNVIAGVSQWEYENIADELVYLNMLTGDSYSPETAGKYLNAYNTGKLSFFEEVSEWGDDYTGLLPLYDSAGNKICALCVDVDVASIRGELLSNAMTMLVIIMALGGGFALFFYFWSARNVTHPLEQLESSVADFAVSCENQKDPKALHINVPRIRTHNEVESLAAAVTKMSEAMQGYVKNIVYTESELARMAVLANQDALTGVRNKNAYDAFTIELWAKTRNRDMKFAVCMIDINDLKGINDTYGHEKGDIYIRECCAVICKTFAHSAVFRVGGDEFVAILLGEDYENRNKLLRKARSEFERRGAEMSAEPWLRASAAIGIAEYNRESDESIEAILSRADKEMYAEKAKMKSSEKKSRRFKNMRIALINENSQAAKNELICATLKKVAEPLGHTVDNYGMYASDDEAQLTYVQNGLLASILLSTGAADYVVTGCGTGEGAMLACNSFPGVLCGHLADPMDGYLFAQINDGNCVAIPFAKDFGWGGELKLELMFHELFAYGSGNGYPKERVVPEQRNKKILDGVKAKTYRPLIDILRDLDPEFVKATVSGKHFDELFYPNCKDEEIAAFLRSLK